MAWKLFVSSLEIFGGVDFADSLASYADPGAIMFVGVGPGPVWYLIDAWVKKSHGPAIVHQAYSMAKNWPGMKAIGWESNAMQRVLSRQARQLRDEWVRLGRPMPLAIPLTNMTQAKAGRIIAGLTGPLVDERFRIPFNGTYEDSSGDFHRPSSKLLQPFVTEVKAQIDGFTDDGAAGRDDAIDALEMAMRVSSRAKGVSPQEEMPENEMQIKLWQEAGMDLGFHNVPVACWTPEMQKAYWDSRFEEEAPAGEVCIYE